MSIGADLAHHPVREVLDEIDALLATVADASLLSLSATEQADLLLTAYERAAQLDGLVVHLVGQCDATGMANQLGAPSMTSWLKSTALLHPATAKATVDTARGIRQGMTTTGDALAAGAVSAAAAAVVVPAVADLPGGAACPAAADAERVLVEAAATLDPVTLTRLGRRVLELVDPDAADAHLGAQLEREEARARRRQRHPGSRRGPDLPRAGPPAGLRRRHPARRPRHRGPGARPRPAHPAVQRIAAPRPRTARRRLRVPRLRPPRRSGATVTTSTPGSTAGRPAWPTASCSAVHHHRFIHTGAWTVRMAADGLPEFLPPVWIDAARRPRRNPRPHRRQ